MHVSFRSGRNTSVILSYPPMTGSTLSPIYSTPIWGELSNYMDKNSDKTPKELEDYEPGASKEQVLESLRKVAEARKKPKKTDSPSEQALS